MDTHIRTRHVLSVYMYSHVLSVYMYSHVLSVYMYSHVLTVHVQSCSVSIYVQSCTVSTCTVMYCQCAVFVYIRNLLVRQATHTRHLARSEPVFTENVEFSAVDFLSEA